MLIAVYLHLQSLNKRLCAPRRLGTVILEKLKSSESVSFLLASKQIPRTPPKPKTSPHPRIPQTQSGKCLFYILA